MKCILALAAVALLALTGTSDARCRGHHRLGHRLRCHRARVMVVVPARHCQPAAVPKAPPAKK